MLFFKNSPKSFDTVQCVRGACTRATHKIRPWAGQCWVPAASVKLVEFALSGAKRFAFKVGWNAEAFFAFRKFALPCRLFG